MVLPDRPGGDDPRQPSPTRVAIWLVVGGIAVYLIVTGLVGALTPG